MTNSILVILIAITGAFNSWSIRLAHKRISHIEAFLEGKNLDEVG